MSKPQLRMTFNNFADLPPLVLPKNCVVRRFRGDEDISIWANLLNENKELGTWDVKRALEVIETGNVLRDTIHFLIMNDTPVATACVQRNDHDPDLPELGWVSVSPAARGQRLGMIISLAVLHHMREEGYSRCFLYTDDDRLPAIKVYLNLGFQPDDAHPSYEERWKKIFERLPT